MHIGNVAEKSGVPAKTVRYYESIGLISSAERTQAGYRIYDEVDLGTLQFIKRARSLGFPVGDVAELLALWCDRRRTSAEVERLAQMRITHIERKLEELQGLKGALLDLPSTAGATIGPTARSSTGSQVRPTEMGYASAAKRSRTSPRGINAGGPRAPR